MLRLRVVSDLISKDRERERSLICDCGFSFHVVVEIILLVLLWLLRLRLLCAVNLEISTVQDGADSWEVRDG